MSNLKIIKINRAVNKLCIKIFTFYKEKHINDGALNGDMPIMVVFQNFI